MPPLRALVAAGFDVALVVTRPDKRRGRGGEPAPSPVKAAAARARPAGRRIEVDDVLDVGADLGVVVAYGALIKPHVLGRAADGQPPLLAAAPLARRGTGRAGAAGRRRRDRRVRDAARGGARHRAGLRMRAACRSAPTRRPTSCAPSWSRSGTRAARRHAADAASATPEPQAGEPTYAAKIEPDDLRLDWTRPADELDRRRARRRGVDHVPGRRLKVLGALPGRRHGGAGTGRIDGDRVGTGTACSCSRRCSRRARRPCRWRRGATAPASAPGERPRAVTTPAASPTRRSCASTTTAPTPTSCCRRCSGAATSTAATGPSSPSSCTARRACAGPATSPSTASSMQGAGAGEVRTLLRLGAYQLLFAGVPAHAAVNDTVALAPARATGLRQRRAAAGGRRRRSSGPTSPPGCRIPDWIVDRLVRRARRGRRRRRPRAHERAAAGDDPRRRLRAGPGVAVGGRPRRGAARRAWWPTCARHRAARRRALAARRAPSWSPPTCDPARARLIAANAARLGEPTGSPSWRPTRTAPPLRAASFDRVLRRRAVLRPGRAAPAPRRPLALSSRTTSTRWPRCRRACSSGPARCVRPGGMLVYSVCTLTAAESIDHRRRVVAGAAPRRRPPWRPYGRGARILPQDADTDGMTVLRYVRPP